MRVEQTQALTRARVSESSVSAVTSHFARHTYGERFGRHRPRMLRRERYCWALWPCSSWMPSACPTASIVGQLRMPTTASISPRLFVPQRFDCCKCITFRWQDRHHHFRSSGRTTEPISGIAVGTACQSRPYVPVALGIVPADVWGKSGELCGWIC